MMRPLHELSLEQLLDKAAHLHLLADHYAGDHVVLLNTGKRRYVFDYHLARTFLLGLITTRLQNGTAAD